MKKRYDHKRRLLKEGEYQRSDGRYEYRWKDKAGKRHSIYDNDLRGLRDKKKDIINKSIDGVYRGNSRESLNDFYEIWKDIKRGIRDNTFKNYIYMYERFVKNDIGKIKIVDIKRSDIKSFYIYLAEKRKLKISTIDCIQNVIHQILELAVEDDYIRYNPADKAMKELKKTYNDVNKIKSLTIGEQKIFEEFIHSSNRFRIWEPIFSIMLWTGMRVGEVLALQWDDIDIENRLINVNKTLVYYSKGKGVGNTYAINDTKTSAGTRKIPMTEKVRIMFIQQKELTKNNNFKCLSKIDGYSDFIFLNRFGHVLNSSVLNKTLKRIIRACNMERVETLKIGDKLLPYFSNHTLRHTFTTRMCEAGVNIKVMQSILGHSSVEITLDIYTDSSEEFNRKELEVLSNFFERRG
ncbi:site-specific integrase [Peptostreptococcus stomatis]|uniref:site-specific integrase n=1 Tax=Peptostreptococcus stomatis TaxID=341694 RepID=UPI0028EBD57A|nr:site-specific integrase [Peptostreptococcus stomatis]